MMIYHPGEKPHPLFTGVAGCGEGSFIALAAHIPALLATGLYSLRAACPSRSEDSAQWFLGNFPGVDVTNKFGGLMRMLRERDDEGSPSVLVLGTPTDMHAEQILHAAQSGVDYVICDKPLTGNLAEALHVATNLRRTKVFTTFNHRYNAPVMQMRLLAASGEVESISAFFLQDWLCSDPGIRQSIWRLGGKYCGLMDIGSHAADIASFILGTQVSSVFDAYLGTAGNHGADAYDNGNCQVLFEGGTPGTLRFHQALPGHADDIGVVMHMKNGTSYMWRMAWGPDTLFVSQNDEADPDKPNHWTAHLRAHSDIFDAQVNARCGLTPGGHIQGWKCMWELLYASISGAILTEWYPSIQMEALPAQMQNPVPTLEDALGVERYCAAHIRSFEKGGGSVEVAGLAA
jgi:predicted dehydrogenase